MSDKIILTGVLQKTPDFTHNGRIYPQESFDEALEAYERKQLYERRKKIIDKLLKNNSSM
jgi:hypothetical protein